VPGLPVGVTYRAADTELEVGGDWYDVIALPDGKAGLVAGDIVGHHLARQRRLPGRRPGLPLSILSGSAPRTSDTCRLEPGDVLVMFSDGLCERRRERLRELVRLAARFRGLPPTELSRELAEAMLGGAPAQDDICVLVAALG
jgi:serine phosphatase RsbU (regulator of sigma subunit)